MSSGAERCQIATGVSGLSRVDVGGVDLGVRQVRRQGGCEGGDATAEVEDYGGVTGVDERGFDQELRASAGDEDAGADGDAQAVEGCPAPDLPQRLAAAAPRHELSQSRR